MKHTREHMNVRSAKLTRINSSIGHESIAEDAVICGEGTIQFSEATDNDTWGVYVPMVGFDEPFYLLFQVSESTIAMCDRKFVVTYCNAELVAALAPKEPISFTPTQYDEDAIARDMARIFGTEFPEWLGTDADFFDEFDEVGG